VAKTISSGGGDDDDDSDNIYFRQKQTSSLNLYLSLLNNHAMKGRGKTQSHTVNAAI
jgi:hypothetical protein